MDGLRVSVHIGVVQFISYFCLSTTNWSAIITQKGGIIPKFAQVDLSFGHPKCVIERNLPQRKVKRYNRVVELQQLGFA